MYVTIVATKYGNCPEYQGAELKVPATREAIQDAMDRARAQGDEAYRMITFRDWPSFLRERLSKIETDIQEVNFLASRVDGMNQEGLSQYEGVLTCIETEREGQECSIKDLINASYNMERFELMPGVVTDAGLGEHAVDGDFMRLLQDIPDEVIELLDLSKVGQCLRRSEKGAFTKDGYCFRSSEGWREVHSGRKQSEQALKTELILSVCIRNRDSPEGVEKWLFLPCSDEELTSVCECFHVPNISRFQITGIYSRIPALEEHIGPDEDIGALNELAEKLKAMTPEECLKYKAVLEFDGWSSVERALWLTDRLEYYVFDPAQISYADYGRECLENLEVDCSDPAFRNFSFYEYGMAQYEAAGMKLTSYGAVSLDLEPDLSEREKNSQQMGGSLCQTM